MRNPYIDEILKRDCNALRALHVCMGFDWCEPYTVYHIDGKFTVNSIIKTICKDDFDPYTDAVAILTRDKEGRERRFHLAAIRNGNVDISIRTSGKYWASLDHFYRKADFDDMRKKVNADTYIICQKECNLKPVVEMKVNYADRFKHFPEKDTRYGDGKGKTWVSSVRVKPVDCNVDDFDLYIHERNYGRSLQLHGESYQEFGDVIDKSGYILPLRRRELKRRANQLRRDHAKAVYVSTDHSAQIDELRSLIEQRKRELMTAFENAQTSDEYHAVGRELNYLGGFRDAVSSFERLIRNEAGKKFDSEAQFKERYESIKGSLVKHNAE